MVGEVEFFRGGLGRGEGEDAVVADQDGEAFAQGLTLDIVDHIAAVRSTECDEAGWVDVSR